MSRPLRILLVLEPGIDGVFRYVAGLADFLRAQGQQVHVAYSDRRGGPALQEFVKKLAEAGCETLNLAVGNSPEPADASAVFRLWKMARRLKPDIIHAHSSKAGVLARMLALTGIRAFYFYTPQAYYGLARRGGAKEWFFNAIETAFCRIGTTLCTSSDEERFAIETLHVPPARLRTIFNPVDTARFAPATADAKARTRRELGLPEQHIILGSMGRLSFQKDPQTLLRAVAPVLRERGDVTLLHVGRGELEDEVVQLIGELGIAERIHRVPYLDEPRRFYEAADAFLLPSRYEGMPLVLLEALACDLPMIVSAAPGMTDILQAGLTHCWSAPPEDVGAFEQAIRSFLADRAAARASNHRSRAIELFSSEKCYGTVLNIFCKVSEPTYRPK
ncbi:MAG: glycosyltransferase family 4 protein [Chthoniobacter sp.]|nr:glycosyltransferase family 4 protein [Chthoniobacter sp.]